VESKQAEQVIQTPSGAVSDEQLVAMLADRARNEGLQLTGEGGLLQQLTKQVLESALEGEIEVNQSAIRWIFEPFLPRSPGFGRVRSPFQSPHVHRVDRTPRPVQVPAGAQLIQDQAVQLGADPGPAPLAKPTVSVRPRRAERRGQLLPGTP
jgi:hypothetical protein